MNFVCGDVMDKVEVDLDLQDETIIGRDEMRGYLNDALRDCRAFLFKLDPDYFLTPAFLELTQGTSIYELPEGIFGTKIRGMMYDNGSKVYRIKKVKEFHKFERVHELAADVGSDPEYRYILYRPLGETDFRIKLLPPAQETSTENVTIWYSRGAAAIEEGDEAANVDIPECINYIYAHMKRSCLKKLNNNNVPPDAQKAVEDEEALIVESLDSMDAESDNNEIPPDFSFYDDHA